MSPRKTFHILDEKIEHRADLAPTGDDVPEENPYWAWDEQSAHPNPELGCIRRGLCCKSSPGWFAPGEVEQAAALKGMAPDAFVRRYLIIDAIEVDGTLVHTFAPVKLGVDKKPALPPASRADELYRTLRGQCIFYDEAARGCGIYEARPTECRLYICTNAPGTNPTHEQIARLWMPPDEPLPERNS